MHTILRDSGKAAAAGTLLAAALLLVAGGVQAHETWLLPSSFDARPGQTVNFTLTSGMRFPGRGTSIKPDRLARAGVRLAGTRTALQAHAPARGSLALAHTVPAAGAATVWLDLAPREIALSDDKVAEYLDEIDASAAIRQAWAAQKGRAPWRETYTKHAKTFVDVGADAQDRSWSEAVGMGLEIVPLANPLRAKRGQSFEARLVAASKPLQGVPMALMIKGARPVFQTTDAQGVARFALQGSGEAMLYAVHLRQLPATPSGVRWESDFTTATLRIRPG